MCGIVGIVSNVESSSVCDDMLFALKKLEYRGYDSAGFCYIANNKIQTKKQAGKISEIYESINFNEIKTKIALSHTRWATHGSPSNVNSHPHNDCKNILSVVHNGIIENYLEIKDFLISEGYTFLSQTDSEVIANLASYFVSKKLSYQKVCEALFTRLEGSFAIGIIIANDNSTILALKKNSPLVIGYGDKENYLASDVYALLDKTKNFTYLKDGQYCLITPSNVSVFDKNGSKINHEVTQVNIKSDNVLKGEFDTFMLKEINDQPSSISSNIDAHIKDSDIFLPGVGFDLKNIERVVIIACGTSYYSGMIAKLYYENIAEIPCSVEIASEFRYRNPVFEKNSLYIFISQSGETADTIAALNYVKEKIDKTSKTLAVVNVSRSTIATMCDGIVECFSGPEIGVASTKNFTCQTLSLLFLTLKIAIERGSLTQDNMMRYVKEIESLPNIIYSVLNSSTFLKSIDEASNLITKGKKAFYIGRNLLCAIAMEGALKLKELSYIPSEGFPAGELKHGPIALIDSDSCVIALSSASILKSKMQSSVEEVSARNGVVILICDYSYIPNDYIANKPSCVIQVSNVADFLTPIVFSIPVQMISYKVAKLLNRDVDKPRNLAKSVTVE